MFVLVAKFIFGEVSNILLNADNLYEHVDKGILSDFFSCWFFIYYLIGSIYPYITAIRNTLHYLKSEGTF